MSDVKQRVIDIVNGREPQAPKNLVDVKADEVVVKVATLPVVEEQFCEDPYCWGDGCNLKVKPKVALTPHEAISDATGFSDDHPAQSVQKPFICFGMYGHTDFILPRTHCEFSSVVAGPLVLNQ